MKNILLLLLICTFCISCSKNDHEGQDVYENMDLSNLEVGQKFYYILLTGDSYFSADDFDFEYTGDTLEIEVISEDEGIFIISEKITEYSNMRTSEENYYWPNIDSTLYNQWQLRNDSLIVESFDSYLQSHLIVDGRLPMQKFEDEEIEIRGWKTTHPYIEGNVELFTTDYSLLGNHYDYLNIYINNVAMQVDGPGRTTVYNLENGIIRTSIYSWWTQSGYGWDKL